MWLDNDWKLDRNVAYADGKSIQDPFELHNVIGDPGEQRNLIGLYPELAERMRRQLESWSLSGESQRVGRGLSQAQGSSVRARARPRG